MRKPTASYNPTDSTMTVTAFGETRTVAVNAPFFAAPNRRTDTALPEFSARCGRTGAKVWPARMTFWENADGSWTPDFRFYKLNKNTGTLLGWADKVAWTTANSQVAKLG